MKRLRTRRGFARALGALALLGAWTAPAGAQKVSARACDPRGVEVRPCLTPFDVAPALLTEAGAGSAGERRTAGVWLLVDEAGAVRAAQGDLDASAGLELDRLALERARSYRFRPASRGGQPVPAWIGMPVHLDVTRDCKRGEPGLLLSAGVGVLIDTVHSDDPAEGSSYLFRGGTKATAKMDFELSIYPAAGRRGPREQVRQVLDEAREVRLAEIEDFRVVSQGPLRVRTGEANLSGYRVTLAQRVLGEEFEEILVVFPVRDQYYRMRYTGEPHRRGRRAFDGFMRQVLGWATYVPGLCPTGEP